MSENHSAPSRQRGASGNEIPSTIGRNWLAFMLIARFVALGARAQSSAERACAERNHVDVGVSEAGRPPTPRHGTRPAVVRQIGEFDPSATFAAKLDRS